MGIYLFHIPHKEIILRPPGLIWIYSTGFKSHGAETGVYLDWLAEKNGSSFNPCGVEVKILQEILVNAVVSDALASCVARSSAAMLLAIQGEWVHAFTEEGFQLHAPSQY